MFSFRTARRQDRPGSQTKINLQNSLQLRDMLKIHKPAYLPLKKEVVTGFLSIEKKHKTTGRALILRYLLDNYIYVVTIKDVI